MMNSALTGREVVGVYLLLKEHETELDSTLRRLMMRVEKDLYGQLSIDEFDRLEELYRSDFDFS